VILSCSVDINESPLPPTTELVNNDPLIESDKDESSNALIIGDTIYIIPRITILDPIPRAVGVIINKKDELENSPSRSGIPKIRRGRPKQQSIVDPAVLLAQELTDLTKSKSLTLLLLAK
jgi:hypothetical protein